MNSNLIGSFEVGVEAIGGDSALVRARFEVEGSGAGELGSLRMNETLMREIVWLYPIVAEK